MIKTLSKLSEKQKLELTKGVIQVEGKAMNRTALGVVDALIRIYPDITFEELKEMLPDRINPSAPKNFNSLFKPHTNRMYGVIQSGAIRKECELAGLDLNASHFIGEGETFQLSDDTEVIVSKVWESRDTETGEHDLQNLIDHVSQYGVRVVSFESKKPFKKGEYHLEVINPSLLELIKSPVKKKFPWWIALLLLLLIIGFIFYITSKEQVIPQQGSNLSVSVANDPKASPLEEIKKQIVAGENTEGQSVNFHEILFEKDSDVLLPESEVYLNEVFQVMTDLPALMLLVVGHTSSEGDEQYNLNLSVKRALSVSLYLQSKGIQSSRLSTDGKGSSEPITSNDTEEGRKLNRRIEFIIMDDGNENN
jgi:outer membrane protein OmpA-like peptidoglycan-associated protein